MTLEGKRALIVGLGKSGIAAARFLHARGASVAATDMRPAEELIEAVQQLEGLGIEFHLGGHAEELFLAHDIIIPSPGVPWDDARLEAARARGVMVAGELEFATEFLKGRVIGITGTNGKTTTTALVGHILEQAGRAVTTAGNIGTPVLALSERSRPDQWHVLELSSFQLEAMRSFRSNIAVILNVTPDHLDRHHSFEAYAEAKSRILATQKAGDFAVLNADDPECRKLAERALGRVVWFSRLRKLDSGACLNDGRIVFNGRFVSDAALPILGPHNLENALAAVAAATLAGVRPGVIGRALKSFKPVEHRLEFVREVGGVAYYNDSKATNVDAAIKACEAFDQGLWIILGGRDKGSDYRPLNAVLAGRAREALLIGEASALIREHLNGRTPVHDAATLSAAVAYARGHARPGDSVVLAPACASFDQFASYAARGSEFKRLVAELVE